MKKYIVITSIFEPTEAIIAFSQIKDYQLIVVGDKKTPSNWSYHNANYISIGEQETSVFELARVLPYNHYCRKMLGYLDAIKKGATVIVDTDDDNIPKANWQFPKFSGDFECIDSNMGFVNIYQLYTDQKIWPRGLPLDLISVNFNLQNSIEKKECSVGIWQGLADEDPDVDAIYRLTDNTPCNFKNCDPYILDKGTVSPFNSQNTAIRKELFSLLYLPTYVTFRFTDILRGLVAQPIMWLYDYKLGFTNATVVQKRNPHDYMKDFVSEMPMYKYGHKVIDVVSKVISPSESIENNLYNAYTGLLKENIVCDKELISVEAWLKDIKTLAK